MGHSSLAPPADLGFHVVAGEDVDEILLLTPGLLQGGGVDFLRPFLPDLGQQHGQTLPGRDVGRVVDESQQGDQVANVRLFEETHAACDLVRNLEAGQFDLEIEGLEVRPIEHSDIAERLSFVPQPAQALNHELSLLPAVHRLDQEGLLAVRPGRLEHLVEMAPLRLGEQDAVGEIQDLRRRAVVGFDAMDLGAGVAVGEGEDIFEVGPAPGVDALGVVAHRHDPVVASNRVHDLGLEPIGILVLVHQHMAEALGEIAGGFGRAAQKQEPEFEQVVVVEHIGSPLPFSVPRREACHLLRQALVLGKEAGYGFGEGSLHVARERDHVVERARTRMGLILEKSPVRLVHRFAQQAFRFARIHDGEGTGQADRLAVDAEGAVPDAVEGSAPEPVRLHAGEIANPVEHFLRRLVGEGEQEDFTRTHPLGEKPGHPVGQGAGLAGAGPGQNQKRPGLGGDGGELFVVELGPEVDRWHRLGRSLIFKGELHAGSL